MSRTLPLAVVGTWLVVAADAALACIRRVVVVVAGVVALAVASEARLRPPVAVLVCAAATVVVPAAVADNNAFDTVHSRVALDGAPGTVLRPLGLWVRWYEWVARIVANTTAGIELAFVVVAHLVPYLDHVGGTWCAGHLSRRILTPAAETWPVSVLPEP